MRFLADLEAIGGVVSRMPLVRVSASGSVTIEHQAGKEGTPNTIVTGFNRNFPKRNDGDLPSPETVDAVALAPTVDFNPQTDHRSWRIGQSERRCRNGSPVGASKMVRR